MMTKAEEHDHLAYWTVLLNWNIFSANSSSVELFLYQTAVYLHLNEVTNTSNQQLLVLCHWLLIHHLQHTAQDGYLKHLSKSLFITIQCCVRQNMQLLSEESSLCPSQFFCPRLFFKRDASAMTRKGKQSHPKWGVESVFHLCPCMAWLRFSSLRLVRKNCLVTMHTHHACRLSGKPVDTDKKAQEASTIPWMMKL